MYIGLSEVQKKNRVFPCAESNRCGLAIYNILAETLTSTPSVLVFDEAYFELLDSDFCRKWENPILFSGGADKKNRVFRIGIRTAARWRMNDRSNQYTTFAHVYAA